MIPQQRLGDTYLRKGISPDISGSQTCIALTVLSLSTYKGEKVLP